MKYSYFKMFTRTGTTFVSNIKKRFNFFSLRQEERRKYDLILGDNRGGYVLGTNACVPSMVQVQPIDSQESING